MAETIDLNGQIRYLGWKEPDEDHLKMRAARRSLRSALQEAGTDLIPRSEWKPVDRRKTFDTSWILNQLQTSGCTGGSGAGMLMRALYIRYGTKALLSGSFIYAHINGGRDQGSVITDAMASLQQVGTCLKSEFDFPRIYKAQIPAAAFVTAKRFMLEEAYTVTSFDEMITAIQLGMTVHWPLRVGNNFEAYDSDGCVGLSRGQSNHAVGCDGVIQLPSREWVGLGVNDWGQSWGREKDGLFKFREAHVAEGATPNDAYAMVAANPDPQGPVAPHPVLG